MTYVDRLGLIVGNRAMRNKREGIDMTQIIEIDQMENNIALKAQLEEAAQILVAGGTVAFPTETVYGLGANALEIESVKKIFVAKGRPSDNPLILHIGSKDDVMPLIEKLKPVASQLMGIFWPGPLTLVMRKSAIVPDVVTGGLDTVALRMPKHPIALMLIRLAGVPIAAPSANISGKPSPTLGKHVVEDLSGKVDCIITSGQSNVGLESTVLDITGEYPMILRPGGVTREDLEAVVGRVDLDPTLEKKTLVSEDVKPKSPGMKYTHYSPKAQVIVIEGTHINMIKMMKKLSNGYNLEGKRVGIMCSDESRVAFDLESDGVQVIKTTGSRLILQEVASSVFRLLREFDEDNVDIILAEAYPNEGIGKAIMNRLNKSAGFNIINGNV